MGSYNGIIDQSPKTGRFVKEDGDSINIANIMEYQIGGIGSEFISDTATHIATDVFTSIQVITDAVIGSFVTDDKAQITGNTLTGVTLPLGTIIYGRFKSIALTSGSIIAYKGV